jgi:K+-transporting ATPase KdpF subunit
MLVAILIAAKSSAGANTTSGYVIGAVLALFILGYLLYSLVKPEKF